MKTIRLINNINMMNMMMCCMCCMMKNTAFSGGPIPKTLS